MYLFNGDGNNNTYNCVIKVLDIGARFLRQNQALPLTSCVALGKLLTFSLCSNFFISKLAILILIS